MQTYFFKAALQVIVILTVIPAALANGTPNVRVGLAGPTTLDDVGTGSLLLKTDTPGRYIKAPLVSSDFEITVTGPIVRGTLSQRFRNPSNAWVEGRYAFPMPDEAAVDGLKMRIGERFIEGLVKEKKKARETYEQAKADGKKAALIEQHRPNLFTNDVANIGPNEVIVVQITWIQTIAPADGAFELRLPLVVAPRYTPAPKVHSVDFGPNGWAIKDPVPDRNDITSPLIDPRKQERGSIHNPVTIQIDLDAGFPLDMVDSRHHDIAVKRPGDTSAAIALTGAVPADQDFVLRWTSAVDAVPHAALFRQTVGDQDYFLAMLTPPEPADVASTKPREVIFVQDISGSMDGESIRQAREGLTMALGRLTPRDRFNIILFNDQYEMWAPRAVHANEQNLQRALAMVEQLQANGGTEMLPALKQSLINRNRDTDRLRQIVFLTDGAVGNEAQMLAEISAQLGQSRLFTVGIGSAPNSYFMTRAAEMGRGSTVYVDDLSRVAEQMDTLFAKLENPVLTNVTTSLPDGAEDLAPNPLPDLYAGDPVIFAFRAPKDASGMITVGADGEKERFAWQMKLDQASKRDGIAKLWARKHIRSLEALAHSQIGWDRRETEIDPRILAIALEHQLVSRLTSLVAVDTTPSRPAEAPLTSTDVALNLPKGWNPAVFLDAAPAPAPQMRKAALSGAQLAMLKSSAPQAETTAAPPRGSLNWFNQLIAGLMLLLSAVGIWLFGRQRSGTGA